MAAAGRPLASTGSLLSLFGVAAPGRPLPSAGPGVVVLEKSNVCSRTLMLVIASWGSPGLCRPYLGRLQNLRDLSWPLLGAPWPL